MFGVMNVAFLNPCREFVHRHSNILGGEAVKNACVKVLIGVRESGCDCMPAYNMLMCL